MSRPSRLRRQVLSLHLELLRAGRGETRCRESSGCKPSFCASTCCVQQVQPGGRGGAPAAAAAFQPRQGHGRPRGRTEDTGNTATPGTMLGDGDGPKSPCEGTEARETQS
ncbi:Succinate dehydrogenase assembly factor 1, mitochondrial [Cricetulus griseus]|uniref:Succinate dehydrogenase assembly factor 1, mitochondrial n=1 Tax=Cricetulus griseus TaxID=10029 RepID=G3GU07_CRIGR|nr:Succinate dehydrogenase assembly factor 1, mitochondrial [Cricetulus griseus]